MRICPECGAEFVEGIEKCSDCEVELVAPEDVERYSVDQLNSAEEIHQVASQGVDVEALAVGPLEPIKEVAVAIREKGIGVVIAPFESDQLAPGQMAFQLLVANHDVAEARAAVGERFKELVEQEGTAEMDPAQLEGVVDLDADEVTCPACGHVGPLDEEGACTDCGLTLGRS